MALNINLTKCSSYFDVEEIKKLIDLRPGDQIASQGKRGKGNLSVIYLHHGIWVGTEHTVIHFSADGDVGADDHVGADLLLPKPGSIKMVDILEFKGDKKLFRINYHDYGLPEGGEKKAPEDVVEIANKLKDDHDDDRWKTYNLKDRNCEHFASFCTIGVIVSGQWKVVEDAADKLMSIAKDVVVGSSNYVTGALDSLGGFSS